MKQQPSRLVILMKVVTVHSPYPDAGKRTILYNLLVIFLQNNPDYRVLVIDVDHGSMKTELMLNDLGTARMSSDLLFESQVSSTMLLEGSITVFPNGSNKKGWIKFLPPSFIQSQLERIPQDEHDFVMILKQRLKDFEQVGVDLVFFILPPALHYLSSIFYFHVAHYVMLIMRPIEKDFKKFKDVLEDILLFMPTRDLLILNKVKTIFFTPEEHVNFLTQVEKTLRIPVIFSMPLLSELLHVSDDALWALNQQIPTLKENFTKIANIFLDIAERDYNPQLRVVEPRARPIALLVMDNFSGNPLFSYFFEHSTMIRQPLLLGAAMTGIASLISETTSAESNDHLRMIDNGRLKITMERGKSIFTVLFASDLDLKLIRIQQQFTHEADEMLGEDIERHRLAGIIKPIEQKLTTQLEKHFKEYLIHVSAVSRELELKLEQFMKEHHLTDEKEAFKRYIKVHRNDMNVLQLLKLEFATEHNWRHDLLKAAGIVLDSEDRKKIEKNIGQTCKCTRSSPIFLLILPWDDARRKMDPRLQPLLKAFKKTDLLSLTDLKELTNIKNEEKLLELLKELETLGFIKSFKS